MGRDGPLPRRSNNDLYGEAFLSEIGSVGRAFRKILGKMRGIDHLSPREAVQTS
ncbi:hypothetical protein Poly59_60670 [Rubripirellula reticaptiva]|uniref:Uncharacterized protein n=1 Tax=Rubripirellula reticaptiva TaxID=2528013 RepID=A0A5C6EBF6_9BACT|nr:hypothetical protein Poly59_60670 [Rubripirellula reticaptiva]